MNGVNSAAAPGLGEIIAMDPLFLPLLLAGGWRIANISLYVSIPFHTFIPFCSIHGFVL
jgi:hypothetical protein